MAQFSYLLLYGMLHHFIIDDTSYTLGTCKVEMFNEATKIREDCLKRIKGAFELVNTVDVPSDSPVGFARKQCLLKSAIDECVDVANENIKNCLNSTQTHGMEIWKKIDKDINNYLCENYARVSFTYFRRDSSCWKEGVGKASEKCFKEHVKTSSPFYDIPKLQEHCSEFKSYESCMRRNLPKNCPRDTINLILPVIKSIRDGICDDITPGPDDYKLFFKNALSKDFNMFERLKRKHKKISRM